MHYIRTNIQALNKQNPAPFSNEIIYNHDTYLRKNGIYLKDSSERYISSIPLVQVVGIDQMYGDDENSLLKLLYAGILNASKKWTMPIQNWNMTLSQLAIHIDGRLDDVLDI